MRVLFHPRQHAYTIIGVGRVPSISECIANAGKTNTAFMTPEGRERGTSVHEVIHQYLTGKSKYVYFRPEYDGYWSAFKRFMAQTQFECIHSEKIVGHGQHLYACRVDIVCRLNGRVVVVDMKTGQKGAVLWQVVANRMALSYNGVNTDSGFALELRADGSYKLIELAMGLKEIDEVVAMVKATWELPKWQERKAKDAAKLNAKRTSTTGRLRG